jgi:acyl-CoA dehydrogenase
MSDRDLFRDTVGALLAAHCSPPVVAAARGGWSAAVWEQLERAGIPLAAVPERHGGAGGSLTDAATAVRLGGYHGVPAPFAETSLAAGPLLGMAGIDVPAGPLSAGGLEPGQTELHASRAGGGAPLVVTGVLSRVPYGRMSSGVVALAREEPGGAPFIVLLDSASASVEQGRNLAGEPRDTLRWDAAPVLAAAPAPPGVDATWLLRRGALARSLQIAGAVQRIAEMGVAYAGEREQFGRPLARFQVIQHQLAAVAEEAAAAVAAAEVAVDCTGDDALEEWTVAAAKVRTGQAASRCAAAVHQVHGAIGVTEEHPLHLFTTRVWSWRDDCGDESYWSIRLGRLAAAAGAAELWPTLTRTSG